MNFMSKEDMIKEIVLHLNRGNKYYEEREFKKAIDEYNLLLDLAPSSTIYHNRGSANTKLGHLDAALSDFSLAIELDQENASNYFRRSYVWLKLRNVEKAMEDCQIALSLSKNLTLKAENLQSTLEKKTVSGNTNAINKKSKTYQPLEERITGRSKSELLRIERFEKLRIDFKSNKSEAQSTETDKELANKKTNRTEHYPQIEQPFVSKNQSYYYVCARCKREFNSKPNFANGWGVVCDVCIRYEEFDVD